jgi:nitrous oxidase accessory protein
MKSFKCILALLLLFHSTQQVYAKQWPALPQVSLQQTIDKTPAGDTIVLNGGRWEANNLTINKQLTLLGQNWPVIDGKHKYEMLDIIAPGVKIIGLVFENSGTSSYNDIAALRVKNTSNATIQNCRFVNNYFGIYIQRSTNVKIIGNVVQSNAMSEIVNANGIHCWKSDSLQIIGNTISGHRDGIYFEFVTNSLIKGNNSFGNVRYGLHFMFSHNDAYINNNFSSNGSGVAVMYTKHVKMLYNKFDNNWGNAAYAILMKDISDSYVEGNEFVKNTTGIFMEGSSRLKLYHNRFEQNGWAIRIQASCDDNVFSANDFIANSFDVATNGSLVLNKFESNYWDKYEGYDLNRDGTGDVPYRPISLFSMIIERNNASMMLYHSPIAALLDKAEQLIPSITPESFKDETPRMKPIRK